MHLRYLNASILGGAIVGTKAQCLYRDAQHFSRLAPE